VEFTLKMTVIRFVETSERTHPKTQRHIPKKNNGIIDYTSLKTSQLDYVFGVTVSSLEFGVFEDTFLCGKKIILHSFVTKLILNTFLLEFP
jgi:hypothetical protein